MKIRVLLVDDEKELTDVLAKRLELRDFDVAVANSGEKALDLLHDQNFDIVLLDVLMPGKGGIETLKEIKSTNPLLHIIMLTGHARVDTAVEGMELGAYDYLIKPTETDELVEKIMLAYSHKCSQEERVYRTETTRDRRESVWQKCSTSLGKIFHKDKPDG